MTDYRELAAAELAKIRRANDVRADRARALRTNGEDTRATTVESEVTATSFRLAEDYMTLAALARDVPVVTPDPGQE